MAKIQPNLSFLNMGILGILHGSYVFIIQTNRIFLQGFLIFELKCIILLCPKLLKVVKIHKNSFLQDFKKAGLIHHVKLEADPVDRY